MFRTDIPIKTSVKLANEEAKRQLLIDKANYEAFLVSSQTILGPDMQPYIPPFADKLITNDNNKILSDDRNVKIQMQTLLDNICDKDIADYILNKLTIDEMKILIPNWNELLIELKKTTKKFTKDTFYNWIMLHLKKYTNTVSIGDKSIPEVKVPIISSSIPEVKVPSISSSIPEVKVPSIPSTTIPKDSNPTLVYSVWLCLKIMSVASVLQWISVSRLAMKSGSSSFSSSSTKRLSSLRSPLVVLVPG